MHHLKAEEGKRILFKEKIDYYKSQNRILSYIDESGFEVDMNRTHGYAHIGKMCYGSQDWNAKGRDNIIAALVDNKLISCSIVKGNVDASVFNTWIEEILLPDLPDNSVVIMYNATFHKSSKTKELFIEHGHTLEFLPPYSPDFNPIEHKLAYAKNLRRKYNCSTHDLFQRHLL